MTPRILGIELRRTNARWLALFLLAFATLTTLGEAERGLTVIALDQRQLLVGGAFPLALGVAAWQARRDRRARMDELLAGTARPRWQRVAPAAAALGIGAIAAYLAAIAVHLGFVLAAGGYVSAAALPILAVGALGLLVPVSLGLALGRWLPFFLVPPVLVVFFALAVFYGDTEAYTEGPGASGEVPGEMLLWGDFEVLGTAFELTAVTARTHLGQAFWLAGLVAAGLLVFAGANPRTRAAAIIPVLAGASFAVVLLPVRYADAYYLDPGAIAPVCTPEAPRVCVLRAHQTALDDLRDPARAALAALAAKLPDAPASVTEVPDPFGPPPRPRADTIQIALLIDDRGAPQPVSGMVPDLRWDLLLGAGTPGCADVPPFGTERRRYDTARVVAAAWLLDREPPAPADPTDPALLQPGETLPAYRELRALPAGEQRARVAALREAELACAAGDRLDLLVGPR